MRKTWGGGGGGCCAPGSGDIHPGSGGGRTAIQRNGEDIVTAGGGGGAYGRNGGASTSYSNGQIQTQAFSSSGWLSVNVPNCGDGDGGGASLTEPGCGGNGGKYVGSDGCGGGGGYYGGGSGGAGGGGGSSYLALLTNYTNSDSGVTNSNICNGQLGKYFNASTCGEGSTWGFGQNGLAVIEYLPPPSPPSPPVPPSPPFPPVPPSF